MYPCSHYIVIRFFLFVVGICGNVGTTTRFRSWSLPRLVLLLMLRFLDQEDTLILRPNGRKRPTTRNSVDFCLVSPLTELNSHMQPFVWSTTVSASESSTTLSPESLHNKFRHLPLSWLPNRPAVWWCSTFKTSTSEERALLITLNTARQDQESFSNFWEDTLNLQHDFRQIEKVRHRLRLSRGRQSSSVQQWGRCVRPSGPGPVRRESGRLPEIARRGFRQSALDRVSVRRLQHGVHPELQRRGGVPEPERGAAAGRSVRCAGAVMGQGRCCGGAQSLYPSEPVSQ